MCGDQYTPHEKEIDLCERMRIPVFSECVPCRRKHRLAFWPFGNFYARTCDLSGESIITTLPPDTAFPIYKRKHWYSDAWTPPEMEVDINRPFFDQLKELQARTPHYHALGDEESINCDYCDDVWESKDCYLSRSLLQCEQAYYCHRNIRAKNSFEATFSFNLEQCYDCTYCFDSYALRHSVDSRNCIDSAFLYDCRNCSNCFMCWNLRNKQYCILNIQYSPAEYAQRMAEYQLGSYDTVQRLKNEYGEHLKRDVVHKPDFNTKSEACVGNFLDACKGCDDAYFLEKSQDCFDVFRWHHDTDCASVSGILNGELCAYAVQSTNVHNVQYAQYCLDCSDAQYLDLCQSCENCFGCVGLRKKQYCILNRQYSKEEYESLRARIVEGMKGRGEYGSFFPFAMAYSGYNTSLAQMHFPLTKEGAQTIGARWEEKMDGDARTASNVNTMPDRIDDAAESVVGTVYECPLTGRPFKIIKQELEFYKKHGIPLPRTYPDERNRQRHHYLLATEARDVLCFFCHSPLKTYYPETWGYEKIACRECYQKEVF